MPLLPDLARTRKMASSDADIRECFPVLETHDDTLDFSIEPASLAAVATTKNSAWQFRTAARFNTAVRGSDAAAREFFPAPHPQDGTLYFSLAPALPAAVVTHADSAGTSSEF